jgi:hypothetical protein
MLGTTPSIANVIANDFQINDELIGTLLWIIKLHS